MQTREWATYLLHLRKERRECDKEEPREREENNEVKCGSHRFLTVATYSKCDMVWQNTFWPLGLVTAGMCDWLQARLNRATQLGVWNEFKSSNPRWLLSICQLRGMCRRLSLGGVRERLCCSLSSTPSPPLKLTGGIWSTVTPHSPHYNIHLHQSLIGKFSNSTYVWLRKVWLYSYMFTHNSGSTKATKNELKVVSTSYSDPAVATAS